MSCVQKKELVDGSKWIFFLKWPVCRHHQLLHQYPRLLSHFPLSSQYPVLRGLRLLSILNQTTCPCCFQLIFPRFRHVTRKGEDVKNFICWYKKISFSIKKDHWKYVILPSRQANNNFQLNWPEPVSEVIWKSKTPTRREVDSLGWGHLKF